MHVRAVLLQLLWSVVDVSGSQNALTSPMYTHTLSARPDRIKLLDDLSKVFSSTMGESVADELLFIVAVTTVLLCRSPLARALIHDDFAKMTQIAQIPDSVE
jgi:hypothetical protein